MFGDVSAGGNYPITTPGGQWKSLVMETVLTAILVSVILNTATGAAASATTPPSRSARRWRCWVFASPMSGASMNPARTLGPDIVATTTPAGGCLAGPVLGAAIAVAIIMAVRDCPENKDEREAAEGGDLSILGTASPSRDGH